MAGRILAAIAAAWLLAIAGSAVAGNTEAKAPAWAELNAQQKGVLAPLVREWDQQPDKFRNKMLGVANRYPKMTPQQQQRVQKRLTDWSKLTPAQREEARKKYAKLKQMPPEKRQEIKNKWHEYQKLPEDERARLRATKPGKNTPTPQPPVTPAAPSAG